jgi:hypothetical protein
MRKIQCKKKRLTPLILPGVKFFLHYNLDIILNYPDYPG